MEAYQLGPIVSIAATEAITAKCFVAYNGTHTVDLPAVGVALFATDSGDQISVQCSGIAVVLLGGTVAAGALVKSDANGAAVSAGTTVDVKVCGLALDGGDAGAYIRVFLGR